MLVYNHVRKWCIFTFVEGEVLEMKRKELYIGTDDYRKLIKGNGYYVDKTLLIEEFFENKAEVTLITRPRRFGKTLNMTMMREFFDITKDSKDIFKDTKIMDTEYARMLNSIPVIYYSFKECNGTNEKELITNLKKVIKQEYRRYKNIIFKGENNLYPTTIEEFDDIYDLLRGTDDDYEKLKMYLPSAIATLTMVLNEYYDIKPIVIIDEYDNPFIEAKANNYYEDVRVMLADIFGNTFKGNEYIDRGIMTGIQRIAQESIFSKFNNPFICTVVDEVYHDKFGLTEVETKAFLEYFSYKLTDEVKNYYDGYRFCGEHIYNPMSIASYIKFKGKLESYWVNTSSNQLIKDVIPKAQRAFRSQFEHLIKNETATIKIDFMTTFQEKPTVKGLWGLLVNSGYVTINQVISIADSKYEVKVPNTEVNNAFQEVVALYMNIDEMTLDALFSAMLEVDMQTFEDKYHEILLENTSFYDTTQKENSYHMLMLGMCVYLKDKYTVKSNIESGEGRADIMLSPKKDGDMNIILEFKSEDKYTIETSADRALTQIEEKKYYAGMKGKVLMIGIAHQGKECKVKHKIINI